MTPLEISVVVPIFNDARYVGEALDSILSQSHPPGEIVVIDDGSTDETAKVVENFAGHVRYVHQNHAGAGAARNRGVHLTRRPFLGFLDADDIWLPEKLELQSRAFHETPALEMVFSHLDHFHSPDLSADHAARFPCPGSPMPCTTAVAMLIRRSSFERVGNFDESGNIGEVVDWYARARALDLVETTLPQALVRRRIHSANTGRLRSDERGQYARILKAALDRRRAARTPRQDS